MTTTEDAWDGSTDFDLRLHARTDDSKAAEQILKDLGFNVSNVRVEKRVRMVLEAPSEEEAKLETDRLTHWFATNSNDLIGWDFGITSPKVGAA